MNASDVRVVHAVPGRVRLRFEGFRTDPERAEEFAQRVAAVPGIHGVDTNPMTGSVVVRYDPPVVHSPEFLSAIAEEARRFAPDLDLRGVAELWRSGNGNGSPPGSPTEQFTEALARINSSVATATGGLDLKALVPFVLLVLGIRGALFDRPLARPAWYDFLWFSFGVFATLHPAAPPSDSAKP